MRLYGTLTKVDKEQRVVSGYASTEATDAHGETILKSAIEAALDDYLEFANIREMHQLSAVGTAEEASVDDRGLYLAAKIVDDIAWGKVTSGVYKGFSIGGKTLARDPDNKKIITKILLTEISLVDRPSNPEAVFDVWKAAGHSGGHHRAVDLLKVEGRLEDLLIKTADVRSRIEHLERHPA
jgi:phage head maturation protease